MILGLHVTNNLLYIFYNSVIFFSSPILTQVPTQDPSKDNDSGNYEDPNGYVTVNVHENETIAGKDPRMSKDEVQPYATFVAGPGHNYLSRDYCNILSFKECRLV